MIAALQHSDEDSAIMCAEALVGGETEDVIKAARAFATLLSENGARLLEVPLHVIANIVAGERNGSTTLN